MIHLECHFIAGLIQFHWTEIDANFVNLILLKKSREKKLSHFCDLHQIYTTTVRSLQLVNLLRTK